MFHVDNSTGVPVMPQPSPVTSEAELFFTEGGNGTPPTYPGPDWFNIVQSELLNVVRTAGISPDKMDSTQLLAALGMLFLQRNNPFGDIAQDGPEAIATALSNLGLGEAAKLPSPKFTTGPGYTLFQSPFMDGSTLRWFSTLTMAVSPGAIGNNQTIHVSFPVAFSSYVGGALSDTDGQNGAGSTVQDLGMRIIDISNTGVTIMSRWQAVPADFGPLRFVITGVIND
ncbi:TPA: hypothetical protein ACJOGX_003906 [Enterobacter kobei]